MYFSVSRVGLCAVKTKKQPRQFSGSSIFSIGENHIFLKEKRTPEINLKPRKPDGQILEKQEKKVKMYRLRKTKIRNKILNFFSLNASKKFCAFYSISFPLAIPDDVAYSVFNTWLTRCRKTEGLKSYLWVAERQKNGTLHFHLITNNRMVIRTVNGFMRTCLINAVIKGKFTYSLEKLNRYNGVDVDNLYHPKKGRNTTKRHTKEEAQKKLSIYVTKYISKNDTTSQRLPWHCSRDISALFIAVNYSDIEVCEMAQLIADNPDAVVSFENEYFAMHFYKFRPGEEYFTELNKVNNLIYDFINGNPLRLDGDWYYNL